MPAPLDRPLRPLSLPQTRILRMLAAGPWVMRTHSEDYTSFFHWHAPNGAMADTREAPVGLRPPPKLASSSLTSLRDLGCIMLIDAPQDGAPRYRVAMTTLGAQSLERARRTYADALATDDEDARTTQAWAIANDLDRRARRAQSDAEDALVAAARAVNGGDDAATLQAACVALATADAAVASTADTMHALRESAPAERRALMESLIGRALGRMG